MKKRFLLFLFSILVALLTISLFGIGEVVRVVSTSNISLLLVAVGCQLAIIFLYAARFKVMSSKYKTISFKDALYISTVGNFINSITPIARIGGQPLMIYFTKPKIGNAKSSAIVLMDTMIDFIPSTVLVIVVLVLFHSIIPYQLLLPLVAFAAITGFLLVAFMKLFLSKDVLARLLDWFIEKIRRFRKLDRIFHAHIFEKSFRLILEDRKLMTKGGGISFLIRFFELLRIWVVFLAIGITLSPATVLIIWAFMILLLSIPWLPGHLGLFEFGASSAFIVLGLAASQAAGGVLLDRFVSFWFVIAFSLAVIWLSRQRLGEIMQLAEKK